MGGNDEAASLDIERSGDTVVAHARGQWTVANSGLIDRLLSERLSAEQPVELRIGDLSALDTAGAWLIYRSLRDFRHFGGEATLSGASQKHQTLLDEVAANDAPCPYAAPKKWTLGGMLEDMGRNTADLGLAAQGLLGFLGLTVATLGRVIIHPSRLRWTPLVFHMEEVGVKAMPIVGLMAFLIGIVIAQQGEFQLRQFGAEIYVVNLLGISILREIAIIITAIMVAGRSGSAFTAQIGTMMLNEEVDAMRTLGIDPVETLVLPRLIAIVLLMPLLTFYADIIALFGGGMFSWLALDIPPPMFLERLNQAIDLNTFMIGLAKAPFFGAVIAIVGCHQGLQVSGGAESVGRNTTSAVVQSIFLVIVLDAAFAVFFSAIGI